ncbi:MAG: glycosyltransferase family 2 protein [Sporomusaceae bacterium]|nr:glycosyltransferase family 2 protein [Sporomusaceae bacterium]
MLPEISIIIATYNAKDYIRRTIDSLLAQTFSNFEIIIVDDASTDRSVDFLKNVYPENEKIRIVTHDVNSGQGIARNTGLTYATGRYVFFIDSDDWIEDDTLETLYQVASAQNADIVACGSRVAYENGRTEPCYSMNFDVPGGWPALDKLAEGESAAMACWNKLYRKELLDKHSLRFPAIIFEDMVFAVKAVLACDRFISIPDVLYNYYQSSTSTTRGKITERHLHSLAEMIRLIHQSIQSVNEKENNISQQIIDRLFFTLGMDVEYYLKRFYAHTDEHERERILHSVFVRHMGEGCRFAQIMVDRLVQENQRLLSEKSDLLKMLQHISGKKIVFFGTGKASQIILEYFPFKIDYYVDNNSQKWETKLGDIIVHEPEYLRLEEKDNLAIIIASQYYEQISRKLEQMGFVQNEHFWNGFERFYFID